jgi:hypothetical protein
VSTEVEKVLEDMKRFGTRSVAIWIPKLAEAIRVDCKQSGQWEYGSAIRADKEEQPYQATRERDLHQQIPRRRRRPTRLETKDVEK